MTPVGGRKFSMTHTGGVSGPHHIGMAGIHPSVGSAQ